MYVMGALSLSFPSINLSKISELLYVGLIWYWSEALSENKVSTFQVHHLSFPGLQRWGHIFSRFCSSIISSILPSYHIVGSMISQFHVLLQPKLGAILKNLLPRYSRQPPYMQNFELFILLQVGCNIDGWAPWL